MILLGDLLSSASGIPKHREGNLSKDLFPSGRSFWMNLFRYIQFIWNGCTNFLANALAGRVTWI